MRLRLMLAGVAALIGLAVPAHADSTDDQFLASLTAAGLTYPDPGRAIAAGKSVCNMANQGKPLADVVTTIQNVNPRLTSDGAAKFTAIAANTYCPTALGPANGMGDSG